MKKLLYLISLVLFAFSCGKKTPANANQVMTDYIKADIYETSKGQLKVTLVGHGSLMFEYNNKIIHVDPYSKVADYSKLPKADLIILTHEHSDHLDTLAINLIKKNNTHFIVNQSCNDILAYGHVLKNGDTTKWEGINIEAVPAYNIVNKKSGGEFYHPQGRGNGYVFTFADTKVYVAGDTENIPEMDNLKNKIDIAFMPKNLPYTMDDDMFIDAAKKVEPKVLYPYHMTEFDLPKMKQALNETSIVLEVRPMSNQ